jgi:hypothetical protein
MKLRTIFGALIALFVPGLGHLLNGEFAWAFFWLFFGVVTAGISNIISAMHIFMLEGK